MSDRMEDLARLLDREYIRDCLARLARGEDRCDAELIAAAYWPDAIVDLGPFKGTVEDYLGWVMSGSPEISATQHFLGQSVIDLSGDTAVVETNVLAYHRANTTHGPCDYVIGGHYLDSMDNVGGDWRIAWRSMVYDWSQTLGDAVDWSAGPMRLLLGIEPSTRGAS